MFRTISCLLVLSCVIHIECRYSSYSYSNTQQLSPFFRTRSYSSRPLYQQSNSFLFPNNDRYSSVPVVGVSSPNILQYSSRNYNIPTSTSTLSSPFFSNTGHTRSSIFINTNVPTSSSFSTTGRSIPQNLLTIYNQRQCPAGSCSYFHSCQTRMQPSKFCTLDNGFTGVCCNAAGNGVISGQASSGFFSSNTRK